MATSKNVKFEDSLKRLEEILCKMEQGDLKLEESLESFEEGVKLIKVCSEKLKNARNRIDLLVKKGDIVIPSAFNDDEDDK